MADGNRMKTLIPPFGTGLFETSRQRDFGKLRCDSSPIWARLAGLLVFYCSVELQNQWCFVDNYLGNLLLGRDYAGDLFW